MSMLFSWVAVVHAQGTVNVPNPLGADTFGPVLEQIADGMFTIAIPLVAIMGLWGGFQIITAAGNEEKFSTGRKTLLYAAIGFVVVMLAGSIAKVIANLFS